MSKIATANTTMRGYQYLAGTDVPAALILDRRNEQNKRNVAKNRHTAVALRKMHPKDWDRLFLAMSDDDAPLVGDACERKDGCEGIEGLKRGHVKGCPGERSAKYARSE